MNIVKNCYFLKKQEIQIIDKDSLEIKTITSTTYYVYVQFAAVVLHM